MYSTSSAASMTEPVQVEPDPATYLPPQLLGARPTWSELGKSVGRELTPFDKFHKCWEAAGPALDTINPLLRDVATLLNSWQAHLCADEPVDTYVLFGMYMIGRRKENAKPTIIFTCQRPLPRKRVVKLVKESGILQNHPRDIQLADSQRVSLPLTLSPIQSQSRFRFLGGVETDRHDSEKQQGSKPGVYYSSDIKRKYGTSVFVGEFNGILRKATIGGTVRVKSSCYGLTVAHAFMGDEPNPIEDERFSDIVGEFDSDDGYNDVEFGQQDEKLPMVTSDTTKRDSPDEGPIASLELFASNSRPSPSRPSPQTQIKSAGDVNLKSAGKLHVCDEAADWALVDMGQNGWLGVEDFGDSKELVAWPMKPAGIDLKDERKVIGITGSRGQIEGKLFPSLIYLCAPNSKYFQGLFQVHMQQDLDEAARKGSS